MKVKITDVAKASGVSIATVSHVINHTRYVSPETTHKVEKAIQALSYSPDITARNFKKGRKGLVGMLVPDLSYSRSSLILKQLEEVMATLTEREQRVLEMRFGLLDGQSRTLEEVGKEFQVTRERIRQIESKALRKLRHPSRSRKLRDFLE